MKSLLKPRLNKMIVCNNLEKVYGDFKALSSVSIQIDKGEFVAIMGKSGSGKSTLLNIFGLIDNFNEGDLSIDGIDINTLSETKLSKFRNEKIGYIFQAFYLEPAYNVVHNVEIPLIIAGVDKKQRRIRVDEVLEKVGLSDKKNDMASTLSGGEKQRVTIARALVNNPEILIADEPCGNLDSENTAQILDIFKALNQEGKTIVMVTHSQLDAQVAKRKIFLKDGKIVNEEADSMYF